MTQREQLAEIQELLDEICGPRAAMYVGKRSFLDLATYVNGYLAGRCFGNALNMTNYINLFGQWVAIRNSATKCRVGQDRHGNLQRDR